MYTILFCALTIVSVSQTAWALGGFSSHRGRHSYLKWGGVAPPVRNQIIEKEESSNRPEVDWNMFPDVDDNEPDSSCAGRKCTANEHCCPGAVCVDTEGLVGTCLPVYGSKQGEPCEKTSDCENGLVCMDNNENDVIFRTCQRDASNYHRKQYNEDCNTSNECMVEKGLCCQVQRRHRQAPRKICIYFKDERACIGTVDGAAAGIASAVSFKKSISKALLGK
ncbi:hypothetical protein CHUAL_000766 [Chamberlinius hualienensis]